MANKFILEGIVRIRFYFDRKSPHWSGMGMGIGNLRYFQLGMGMEMTMNISRHIFILI